MEISGRVYRGTAVTMAVALSPLAAQPSSFNLDSGLASADATGGWLAMRKLALVRLLDARPGYAHALGGEYGGMDRHEQRALQYLALPTAAALVHIHVVGTPPDASAPDRMRKTLQDIAHSLATLTPIYSMDGSEIATEIPGADLLDGSFTRGAHAFVTKTGKEYRRLVVQRREMNAAINILRRARVHW